MKTRNMAPTFSKIATLLLLGSMLSEAAGAMLHGATSEFWMPEEGDKHKATWMAFAANEEIWGSSLVDGVKQDLIRIASHLAKYEPVHILVSPVRASWP